ncbi:SEC7-like protein [Rozella allomycis CSF55]|uniref:SEC7-like protein n=1 Tax=Rozella allomycis (strain CSF55) TaxID=988480 RepID=A0A075AY38_ROZAC|nr:SEC7-like, alpha orthogonal bundle domain-containing protein [Rozella allomycis CSF55]RKP22035.1 SEC7-like protein [Rozella allomycis CSF55]|eukprot:EPZ33484.1 SEC7-like, alpha orthogonal bundle domain-containing protein [Rozella allomycis CSF55]
MSAKTFSILHDILTGNNRKINLSVSESLPDLRAVFQRTQRKHESGENDNNDHENGSITPLALEFEDENLTPKEIAIKLKTENYYKQDITNFLSCRGEKNQKCLEEYMKLYDFTGLRLDEALREFTKSFYLTGEGQQLERILTQFSIHFYSQNSSNYENEDVVVIITNALVMLNTDLHNNNNTRKMSRNDFVINCTHALGKNSIPQQEMYNSVKSNKFQVPNDISSQISRSLVRKSSLKASSVNSFIATTSLSMDGEDQPLIMEGLLLRKYVLEAHKKRATNRSWKTFYAVLRGSELYFYKPLSVSLKEQKFVEKVHIRHSFTEFLQEYKNKTNVFALTLINGATESEHSMKSWINYLNYMAALHSAPPLPAALGSVASEYFLPVMPSHPTRFNPDQQKSFVKDKMLKIQEEIYEHIQKCPEESSIETPSSLIMHSWNKKLEFLNLERKKYALYCQSLNSNSPKKIPDVSITIRIIMKTRKYNQKAIY